MVTLSDAFNTMAERLETLVRSHEEFVADASHQLRTPLQALRLRLENAEALSAGDARADLQSALAEVARLGRLVDGLLALARAERETAHTETVDVTEIVNGRRDAWEPLANERGIAMRTVLAVGPLRAIATPGHLDQMMDNLISNALDASPEGGAIELRAAKNGSWIEVHVVDQGEGMTPEQRQLAQDRFWRAPDSTRGGTGLGLTITTRLAKLDGGDLDLRDADGHGVDAVVLLRPPL
jgi:signal transduction histidine kinase